jgi:hypothetical protein
MFMTAVIATLLAATGENFEEAYDNVGPLGFEEHEEVVVLGEDELRQEEEEMQEIVFEEGEEDSQEVADATEE